MGAEAQTQNLIMDWLAAEQIFALRMNTGAVKTENRFFRFGVKGMADILAFPVVNECIRCGPILCPMWIEVKSSRGQQSAFQKSFQFLVESRGHKYVLARTLEDVQNAIAE